MPETAPEGGYAGEEGGKDNAETFASQDARLLRMAPSLAVTGKLDTSRKERAHSGFCLSRNS